MCIEYEEKQLHYLWFQYSVLNQKTFEHIILPTDKSSMLFTQIKMLQLVMTDLLTFLLILKVYFKQSPVVIIDGKNVH